MREWLETHTRSMLKISFLYLAGRKLPNKINALETYISEYKGPDTVGGEKNRSLLRQFIKKGEKPETTGSWDNQTNNVVYLMKKIYLNASEPGSDKHPLKSLIPPLQFPEGRLEKVINDDKQPWFPPNDPCTEKEELADILERMEMNQEGESLRVSLSSEGLEVLRKVLQNKQPLIGQLVDLLESRPETVKSWLDEGKQFLFKQINEPKDQSFTAFAASIVLLIEQTLNDCRKYSRTFNISFSSDGEIRTLYNLFNLYLHHVLVEKSFIVSFKKRKIYFAAAALHPVQDDFIDRSEVSDEALGIVHLALKGTGKSWEAADALPCEEERKTIRIIVELIEQIYRFYPPEKHPGLLYIFNKLYEWQLESKKQQTSKLTDEELLDITMKKGGFAFAFYGYLVTGNAEQEAYLHFFIMGAVFQLLDDLHDVQEDLEEESITVWTRAVHQGEWGDGPLNGVLALQQYYEQKTRAVPSFSSPVSMRLMEGLGIRYDIFRFCSMHLQLFSPDFHDEFAEIFPFSKEDSSEWFSNYQDKESTEVVEEIQQSLAKGMKNLVNNKFIEWVL